jgi:hypothetical protein
VSAWWVVLRKELLDAFRDRRMVVVALVVMPLAVPLILAGMSALGTQRQVEKLESTLELPVIGTEHAPNLVACNTRDGRRLGSHASTTPAQEKAPLAGPGRRPQCRSRRIWSWRVDHEHLFSGFAMAEKSFDCCGRVAAVIDAL